MAQAGAGNSSISHPSQTPSTASQPSRATSGAGGANAPGQGTPSVQKVAANWVQPPSGNLQVRVGPEPHAPRKRRRRLGAGPTHIGVPAAGNSSDQEQSGSDSGGGGGRPHTPTRSMPLLVGVLRAAQAARGAPRRELPDHAQGPPAAQQLPAAAAVQLHQPQPPAAAVPQQLAQQEASLGGAAASTGLERSFTAGSVRRDIFGEVGGGDTPVPHSAAAGPRLQTMFSGEASSGQPPHPSSTLESGEGEGDGEVARRAPSLASPAQVRGPGRVDCSQAATQLQDVPLLCSQGDENGVGLQVGNPFCHTKRDMISSKLVACEGGAGGDGAQGAAQGEPAETPVMGSQSQHPFHDSNLKAVTHQYSPPPGGQRGAPHTVEQAGAAPNTALFSPGSSQGTAASGVEWGGRRAGQGQGGGRGLALANGPLASLLSPSPKARKRLRFEMEGNAVDSHL